MSDEAKQILDWFQEGDYSAIFERYQPLLQHMLFIETREEWKDFTAQGGSLEARPVELHLAALAGECLCLDGYQEDVTQEVRAFLAQVLPGAAETLDTVEGRIFLDLDERDGMLEPQLAPYQALLTPSGVRLRVEFDDTYCAGEYFLFMEQDG